VATERVDPSSTWWERVQSIAARTPGADVLLVADGVVVGEGFAERLAAAALSDDTVASASALVVDRDPETLSVALHPRLSTADERCVYVRHEAVELVTSSDWCAAAIEQGLQHVLADDVLVAFSGVDGALAEDADESGALERARRRARVARDRLSVTVDARAVGSVATGGTQVYTVELVLALARHPDLRVRVLVPRDLGPQAAEAFAGLELVTYEQAAAGELPLSDVVHRPQQVFGEPDLALLRQVGESIVVTQQDLIAYRNPTYHAGEAEWHRFRRASRLALDVADQIVFFSEHARREALHEGLVEPERATATGIGAEELWERRPPQPRPPAGGAPGDGPFLLCLGADFHHKNRPFAIDVLAALRADHGFEGGLVLAGPHVPYGSSAERERARLRADPELGGLVLDVGPVDEAERAWLLGGAAALLYPTLYEGYGLLPREAARTGIPCLYAPVTALRESAGAAAATLVPWDAAASAAAAAPLLRDGTDRAAHLDRLRLQTAQPIWGAVVDRLVNVYARSLAAPRRGGAARAWQELERERYLTEVHSMWMDASAALTGLREQVGALAGPAHGGLLDEGTRRGLLRIAARPWLRRALLAPARVVGRERRLR
jgi:hypothetical protein